MAEANGYEGAGIYLIPIDKIVPDENQPRQFAEQDESLQELAESIKNDGQLQNAIVRDNGDGTVTLISGERRYHAAKLAGKTELVCKIVDVPDPLALALIENIQRKNLTAMEEAIAVKQLQDRHNLMGKDLADRLGKAESTVSEILKLNDLPEEIQTKVLKDHRMSRAMLLQIARRPKAKLETKEKQYAALLKKVEKLESKPKKGNHESPRTSLQMACGTIDTLVNNLAKKFKGKLLEEYEKEAVCVEFLLAAVALWDYFEKEIKQKPINFDDYEGWSEKKKERLEKVMAILNEG